MLKKTLSPFLMKLGFEEEKVAALFNAEGTEFNSDAIETLISHDAIRIQKIKTDATTTGFENGHKKGLADGAKKLEKEVKEKYGIESEKIGIELFDEVLAAKTPKPEIEEDKVKAHPVFVKMKDELTAKVKAVTTEWETKYTEREKQIAKETVFKNILSKGRNYVINELKPILPKDQAKAERQMQLLVNELSAYEFEPLEGVEDDFIIKNKEGKVIEDKHSNRVTYKSLVKGIAEGIWDFQQGTNISSPGNSNEDGNGQGQAKKINVKTPQNEQEYMIMIKNAQSPEERIAIDDAWTKAKGGGN